MLCAVAMSFEGGAGLPEVTDEQMKTSITIHAPAEVVFGLLADPSMHQAIEGTGWVREARDAASLTEPGQVFRIAMYHDNHPDGSYEMSNRVDVFDPPTAIAWRPGQPNAEGELEFGGWTWRYDLDDLAAARQTRVTLTYDWSAVAPELREHISFPPFDAAYLDGSLKRLAELAERQR